MTSLINRSKNVVIARNVEQARTIFSRMQGLLGRAELSSDVTLWIGSCNSIHTFFMKFTIDAVFVDKNLVVRKVVRRIQPWRLVAPVWGASSVFEFAAGVATPAVVTEGDQLHVGH
jgi:uncharacterized protein